MLCIKSYIFLHVSAVYAASSHARADGCTAEDAEDLASFLQVDLHAQSDASFERELAEQRRILERELAEQHVDAHSGGVSALSSTSFERELGERRSHERELAEQQLDAQSDRTFERELGERRSHERELVEQQLDAQSDRTFERELGERRTYERELGEQLAQQQALEEAVESASLDPTSLSSQLQHQARRGHSAAESQASEGRTLIGDHIAQDTTQQLRAKSSHKGESLLGVTAQVSQSQSQGGGDTTALVSRLSHAVEAQTKAMMMLESEVEEINAREIALERTSAAKPECSLYSKQGYGPITDTDSCKNACEKAEGLKEGSFLNEKCSCKVKQNAYRTICGTSRLSISLLATLGMLFFFFRL
jgi:hypothetical protein